MSQYKKKPAGDTPEEQLTIEAQGVPDLPVALPAGYLSCLSCGIAVPWPADENDIVRRACYGKEDQPPPPVPETKPISEIAFTRCPDCAQRDALARRIVTETNALSRRFREFAARAYQHSLVLSADQFSRW